MIRRLLLIALLLPGIARAATCVTSDSWSATVCAKSPTIYWRLDEPSGTTVNDSSGNGNNGTYTSGITLNQSPARSIPGKSAKNDGSTGNAKASVADFAGLNLGTGNWTIIVWVQFDNTLGCSAQGEWISKGSTTQFPQILCASSGTKGPAVKLNGSLFGPALGVGGATFVGELVTRTSTTNVDWYQNGSLVTSIAVSSSWSINTTSELDLWFNSTIGNATSTYTAGLDEFAFFPTSMNATDATNFFNCGNTGSTGCAAFGHGAGMFMTAKVTPGKFGWERMWETTRSDSGFLDGRWMKEIRPSRVALSFPLEEYRRR